MTTDIERQPLREMVVPGTGEIVNLEDPAAVARALRDVKAHKTNVDAARSLLEALLVEQSTIAGTKTLRLEGVVATIGPDSELAWDVTVLVELLAAGLPQSRYEELVKEVVEYKVSASVASQIEKANPAYAAIIARARSRTPKRPSVKVDAA